MGAPRVPVLLLLVACSLTGVSGPDAPPGDTGTPTQWVYENGCRALADYFLVQESRGSCLIASFADRLPPAEGSAASKRRT